MIQGLDFLAGSEETYYDTQDVQRYVFWYICSIKPVDLLFMCTYVVHYMSETFLEPVKIDGICHV